MINKTKKNIEYFDIQFEFDLNNLILNMLDYFLE